MSEEKEIVFDLFRFQLVPRSSMQLNLFDLTREEVIAKKNHFFGEVLRKREKYSRKNGQQLAFKVTNDLDDIFVFRIGSHKHKKVQNQNLEVQEIDDYPDVYVIINNDPNVQKIAISRNTSAFSNSFVVTGILENNFTVPLASYSLAIYIKPIFEEKEFWSLIDKYEGRLRSLRFELIKPNLANISGTFKDEIREAADSVNSHVTNLNFNAPEDSTLENVNENNKAINGLVKYASEGGGEVSIKAKGIKRIIKTKKSVKEISIRDIELKGEPKEIINILKQIVK